MSITFQGIPAAGGVALGDIYLYERTPPCIPPQGIAHLSKPVIILAHELLPSDIAALDPAMLVGVVTEQGGPTSHTALLARQMGIPAVVGVPGLLSSLRALKSPPQCAAIDGDTGTVEIDPEVEHVADYEQARLCYREHQQDLQTYCSKPAVTTDGVVVEMSAHIEGPQDAKGALAAGAESIGLFRTEGLFLDRAAPPTVETPAAALLADVFAREADFFSIGTNDLAQYTLARDRTNASLADPRRTFHPALMRSVAHIVMAAHKYRRWVGVCGEIASDPRLTPFLVGLGVNELSMEPNALNAVKQAISRTTGLRAEEGVRRVLQADTAEEVESILSALAGNLVTIPVTMRCSTACKKILPPSSKIA